ncbi:MAG: PEP-CTERM sorting domain-containing protein [Cyanobacteria bacterium J06641_2]
MFSNIFQKTALLGASTVASVALTGTMMASSAQAATMSYTSEFSITSNNFESIFGNGKVATGDFSFTKTELTGANSGLFSYKLTDFNSSFGAFGINQSLNLSDVRANPNPFLAVNQAFVPDKYQAILPSVIADEDSNYIGDGDFPPPDFIREFSGEDFAAFTNQLTPLISNLLESSDINADAEDVTDLMNIAFSGGGKISFKTTSTSIPEPTTIFGLGIVGVGLTATRRKRTAKKIKQKTTV